MRYKPACTTVSNLRGRPRAPGSDSDETDCMVNLGDLKIQSTEHSTHVVPEALSAAALVLGVLLLGAGLYQRR